MATDLAAIAELVGQIHDLLGELTERMGRLAEELARQAAGPTGRRASRQPTPPDRNAASRPA